MNPDDENVRTIVIAWAVIVTVLLAILLPYTLNAPTLPALFFKTLTSRSDHATAPWAGLSSASTPNPEGLLVWYDFEENIGRNSGAADRSGTGNNAYAKGLFIGNAPGIIGNSSVSLSGLGYLYASHNPVPGRTNITFSLWFTTGSPEQNERIAGAVSPGGPRSGWIIGTQSSDLWDDAGNPIRVLSAKRSFGTIVFHDWNHKAVVYNGSTVREYLNGNLISEYEASGKPVGSAEQMMIGSWQPFGGNYAGRVDDFRIYDHALPEGEVMALYRQGQVQES